MSEPRKPDLPPSIVAIDEARAVGAPAVDKPWLFHLEDGDRSTIHSALVDLCDAFGRRNVWASIREGGGSGGVILPRAIRIEGQRRAASIRAVEHGLSISAPATRASNAGYLHILGPMAGGYDPRAVPSLLASWRDAFGAADPERRIAAARNHERIRQIVSGCLELLPLEWSSVWMCLGAPGHHSLTVRPPIGGQTPSVHFAARPAHPSVGTMTPELVAALDAIVGEGIHVFEGTPRWRDNARPSANISEGRFFDMRHERGPLDAMRAIRAVPPGARLVMSAY